MHRSRIEQQAVAQSLQLSPANPARSVIVQWHRDRLQAIEAQLARVVVQRDPRRSCQLREARQRHVDFLQSFGTPPPRPTHDQVMARRLSSDWRARLEHAFAALHAA